MTLVENLLGEISRINLDTFQYVFSKRLDIGRAKHQDLDKNGRIAIKCRDITKELAEAFFAVEGMMDFDFDSLELTIQVSLTRSRTIESIDAAIRAIFVELDIKAI